MKNNRNILFGLLALLFVSVSCINNNEEYLFGDNPNVRFEKLKGNYVKTLIGAENGWIGYYAPNDKVGGFAILMKFDKEGNVQMASDYNKGANDNTTTYRIDKKLKIQLVFESHGILHQIYETAQNGVEGEYVFNILNVTDDAVELESATDFGYDGSGVTKLTLKKATADDWNFEEIYKTTPKLADTYKANGRYWRTMYVEGTTIKASFSYIEGYNSKAINRYSIIKKLNQKGGVTVENVPIAITKKGFKFLKPYMINGKEVTNFEYDEEKNYFVSKDGGQTTIVEHTEENPVVYYPAVAMGEDGKYSSQLYFHSRWFPSVKASSSFLFKLQYKKSKVDRFYIDFNTDADGQLAQKEEAIINLKLPAGRKKVYRSVFCTVERVKDKTIRFKIKGELKDYIPVSFRRVFAKKLMDILTNPKGFYVEETEHPTPFKTYKGYIYISVANPAIRFSTIRL